LAAVSNLLTSGRTGVQATRVSTLSTSPSEALSKAAHEQSHLRAVANVLSPSILTSISGDNRWFGEEDSALDMLTAVEPMVHARVWG
jgi:hypothetical protein